MSSLFYCFIMLTFFVFLLVTPLAAATAACPFSSLFGISTG